MRRFLGRPQLALALDEHNRPIPTSDLRCTWDLTENFAFEDDDGEMITARKGLRTDLGSVPRIAWSLGFPPDSVGVPGFIVHDALCRSLGREDDYLGVTRDRPYTPEDAAGVLKRALAECGLPTGHRERIYRAVLVGGPRW